MRVGEAAPRPLVADWLAAKAVPHRYQLGAEAGAGFDAFGALYRPGAPPPAAVAPGDAFAVISTAAVDVIPRGAVLTHANILTANLTVIAALGLTPRDRYLAGLPLFHVTPLGMSLAHLHAGAAVEVLPHVDPEQAVRLIDQQHVPDVSDCPPGLANLLDAAETVRV